MYLQPFIRCACCLSVLVLFASPAAAQTGKCCLPDGRGCRNVTQSQCDAAGGVFVSGQLCASENDICDGPPVGACCAASGVCAVVLSTMCNAMGTTFILGGACTPSPCSQPAMGACCQGGTCAVTTRTTCIDGQGEWYQDQPCTPDLCHLGACCTGALSCVVVTQQGCEQGTWTADGTCVSQFCIAHGLCCRDDGTCVVTTESDCTNHTFVFGGSCSPGICSSILGACCHTTTCAIASQFDCGDTGGVFQGSGSACGAPGNPTTCCPANFNQVGGVSVQDIFDFLSAYFGNDTRADLNHSGAISVQDIFDFLSAYFTGCA